MKRVKPAGCFYTEDAWDLRANESSRLISMAQALGGAETQRNQLAELATGIESGMYRVPATALAACLMLEMLQ
jgi:hypothetical protein